MKKFLTKGRVATLLGLLMAVLSAIASGFTFNDFDANNIDHWIKLLAVVAPAVIGYYSQMRGRRPKSEQ